MNGKHLFTILLIIFVLFVVQGCKTESPVSPAPTRDTSPSPPSPTAPSAPSATWTPAVAVSPSPTVKVRTPTPTPNLEMRFEEFIDASPYDFQSAPYYHAAMAYGVHGLEYLVYLSPQTNEREALIKSILNKSFQHDFILELDWLLETHLQTVLLAPMNEVGKVLPEIQEKWSMTETDLDADQEPDYLFLVYFPANADTLTPNVFYWLHKVVGVYQLTEIVRFNDFSPVNILSVEDITNNGIPDLTFQAFNIGSPISTNYVHMIEWHEDHWTEIPILPPHEARIVGNWYIEKTNEKTTLVSFNNNSALLGGGSTPSYEIRFEYVDGVFIPVDVYGGQESEFDKILWADQLTAFGFPKRALDVLLSQQSWESKYPPANYLAYVLFRIGMLNLYLGDVNATQEAWQRIQIEASDSAVALSVPDLLHLLEQPAPLWKVCHWLKENEINWVSTDFDPTGRPGTERLPYDWHSMCSDFALVRWQMWVINRSLQEQAKQLGLEWTLFSDEYDLNHDTNPDLIGRLGNWLWVFLSDGTHYNPMLVGLEQPQQALWLENSVSYAIDPNRYNEVHVVQDSPDTPIWLELIGPDQTNKYEWTGEYFKFRPIEGLEYSFAPFASPPDPNNLLTQALLALFRDQNPQRALELLQNYTSEDEWLTLTARYVTAIALKYSGQEDVARAAFESIIVDYPDTGWATFAREHLQDSD